MSASSLSKFSLVKIHCVYCIPWFPSKILEPVDNPAPLHNNVRTESTPTLQTSLSLFQFSRPESMAPSTTSTSQSSPLQEPTHPKRSLRNRGSNPLNSNQNEMMVIESDKLVQSGGGGVELDGDQNHKGGASDAHGKNFRPFK